MGHELVTCPGALGGVCGKRCVLEEVILMLREEWEEEEELKRGKWAREREKK